MSRKRSSHGATVHGTIVSFVSQPYVDRSGHCSPYIAFAATLQDGYTSAADDSHCRLDRCRKLCCLRHHPLSTVLPTSPLQFHPGIFQPNAERNSANGGCFHAADSHTFASWNVEFSAGSLRIPAMPGCPGDPKLDRPPSTRRRGCHWRSGCQDAEMKANRCIRIAVRASPTSVTPVPCVISVFPIIRRTLSFPT